MTKRVFLIASILSLILVPTMIQAQMAAGTDFDGSGTVDFVDFVVFTGGFGSSQALYDLDGNGTVDFPDFVAFAQFFGHTIPPTTIVVSSSADSGSGTLRQALLDATMSDVITFDSGVFPPEAPVTISLVKPLPGLSQGHLTIDASNAGVILDGSKITEPELVHGLTIFSNGNTIRGLQIMGFSEVGIGLLGGARHNLIGGDRGIGAGPLGQGNLLSGNGFFGIGIWSEDTAFNTIIGNYIGTDLSGLNPLANLQGGIIIDLSAHDNVIGPNNIIAHNNGDGIAIGSNSLGNTIIQNSIHDNGRKGIELAGGGNSELPVPVILGFDLQAGGLTGWASPNNIVEIFSDSSDEGAFYEGRVVADSSGFFTFRKDAAFTGPHLTANATDLAGNTSEFSWPTKGSSGNLSLQEGNSLAKIRLQSKSSSQLVADVRLGYGLSLSPGELQNWGTLVHDVFNLGAKRLDTSFTEGEPPINWSFSENEIPVEYDRFIDAMNENGVAVNYLIHYWDKIGHAAGEELPHPRFKTNEEVQKYLDYVRFIVGHFKGRVQYYTIWSEPDNCGEGSLKCIEPLDYIELARQTIPVIREEDPQAKVVTGPVVLYFGRDHLFTLLRSDVIQLFDVISTHPMYDAAPDIEFYGNYYYEYPSIIEDILQTASAYGFQGQYWGAELTWFVTGSPEQVAFDQPWEGHTEIQSAKYYARGIVMHLGLDAGVGSSVQRSTRAYSASTNLYTILAGSEPINLGLEIESEATNIVSYGFTHPNGDTLFALWTDGAAVDNDPGVKTTLTFPGVSASRVTGIDVLDGFDGFEQELIVETGSGDLIIRNLLVKDYPIIVRLTD